MVWLSGVRTYRPLLWTESVYTGVDERVHVDVHASCDTVFNNCISATDDEGRTRQ